MVDDDRALIEPRRRVLVNALAAGILGAGITHPGALTAAGLFGRRPRRLPAGRSFYKLDGEVTVNGVTATLRTFVRPGAEIRTGPRGRAIFVVGTNAYALRSDSRLKLPAGNSITRTLRLFTGRLLSVFGRGRHRITTPLATLGIRGTGAYVESYPDRSYVCVCYGLAELMSVGDESSAQTIESEHHDSPRYVLAGGAPGQRLRPAPFINHTDIELTLLEALVGREPPFPFAFDRYRSTRERY